MGGLGSPISTAGPLFPQPSGQTCPEPLPASQLGSYHDAGVGLVVVGGVHALEPLLARCVPKVCNVNTALTA